MLTELSEMLSDHFKHQHEMVHQSLKPFVQKVHQADSKYNESLYKFLKKRNQFKVGLKDSKMFQGLDQCPP